VRHVEGFGGRQGAVRRPALLVIDMSLGFTSPDSPLHCDLDGVVGAIGRLLDAARAKGLPVVYTTVSYGEGEKAVAKAFIEKVPALLALATATLAALWRSAWIAGGGDALPASSLTACTEPELKKKYNNPSFLAALSLDEMAASGTYEPPAASDASSQSEGSTSRRAVG